MNVQCDVAISFRGRDIRIANLTCPYVELRDNPFTSLDSTGVMVTPLAPDPTQVADTTAAGSWRVPVLTNTAAPAASTFGTVVKKLAAYDAKGNLIGYLPVYDSIT